MLRRLLFALLVCGTGPLGAAEPVALVTELSGTAVTGVKPRTAQLELLQDLAPGTRLSLESGARATIVHTATGVVYELNGPGSFRVQAKSVEAADAKARVAKRELPAEIRTYKLNPMVAAQASIVLRSGRDIALDGPDGGVLDEEELRYRVLGELRETRFEVFDEQGVPVLRLDAPERVVDLNGRHPWAIGRGYRVQMSGVDRNGRAVVLNARFALMPPDAVTRLRGTRPADATAKTDWIVYALALESLGANASARPIWKALSESH